VEVKLNAKQARIAKLDIGPKGAVVTLAPDGFPDLSCLIGKNDRLKVAAKLTRDSKMTISRDWPTPDARLDGALQLSRGLARVAAASERKAAA
jgi:transcription-repair coupling factor (superfamily II helicase)